MRKQVVVLANSVKHDPGRCIAGREIAIEDDDFAIGPWVRPVSRIGEGELHPRHFTFEDGSVPQIFDVIELFVETPDTDPIQPENWLVSEGRAWKRVHQWDTDMVIGSLIENPPALWLQPEVKTDRVTKEFLAANPPQQSLYLLQLQNATIRASGKKFRLRFTYRGVSYDLAITDPLIANITGGEPVSVLRKGLACVSLAPSFRNQFDGKEYHYKLAAMVISYD